MSSWKCTRTISEDSGLIYSIATSPSGKILVCGTGKNTVRVWNLRTNLILHTDIHSAEYIYCVATSPDGRMFASAGSDKTIVISQYKRGLFIPNNGQYLYGHSGFINSLVFSPDSKFLVSGSNDSTIRVWEIKTGKIIHILTGHEGSVNSIAISQDGKYIISGSDDNKVKIWSLSTGNLINTLLGHSNIVYSVASSYDGQIIASSGFDKTIRVWNLKNTESQIYSSAWISHKAESFIYSVAINNDKKTLASIDANQIIQIWNIKTGELIQTLKDHEKDTWSSGLLGAVGSAIGFVPSTVYFGKDKNTLISATHGKIRIWERESFCSPEKTIKYYENLIYEQTKLVSQPNNSVIIEEEIVYKLADFFLDIISDKENLLDILNVEYKTSNCYLAITNQRLLCFYCKSLTSFGKRFDCDLNIIQNLLLGKNGMSWKYNNTNFKIYFNYDEPNEQVLSSISYSKVKTIDKNKLENKYKQSGTDTASGCFVFFLSCLVMIFTITSLILPPKYQLFHLFFQTNKIIDRILERGQE